MREPRFVTTAGDAIPFSSAPAWMLFATVRGLCAALPSPENPGLSDDDFRRRYAAILLRERNL